MFWSCLDYVSLSSGYWGGWDVCDFRSIGFHQALQDEFSTIHLNTAKDMEWKQVLALQQLNSLSVFLQLIHRSIWDSKPWASRSRANVISLLGALHRPNFEIVLVTKPGYENREFYTLECLLYFWKHSRMPVNLYESQAQSEGVPWVKRQDRKAVISYLRGDAGERLFSPLVLKYSKKCCVGPLLQKIRND